MSARILTAAAMIAGLTVVTRLVGFLRTLVFAGGVGSTDLGDVYQTANTIPNLIFEVVAGGALAVVVVPLLAGHVAAGESRRVAEISSALLTWTVAGLAVLAAAVVVFAAPIVTLLVGADQADQVAIGARMLRVFAWQLPLYGAGIVLTGILHAHRRFAAAVLAPLLSSVVVIGAYLTFAAVDAPGTSVAQVSQSGELVLSVGTTFGVVVLAASVAVPVARLRLGLRPRLEIASAVRRRAIALAGAAAVTVAAQQLTLGGFIRLANGGPDGALVLFALAQAVFLVPWAVLAVPLSTPTVPVLAEAAAIGDRAGFDAMVARTTRALVLAAGLGVAGLVGVAVPLGTLLSVLTATHPAPAILAAAIAGFAPGLFGFALFTFIHRALIAAGEARRAAGAAAFGWVATLVGAWILSVAVDPQHRVIALAVGNSVGMTLLGAAMMLALVRCRPAPARRGVAGAVAVALVAAAPASAIGWVIGASTLGASMPGGAAGIGTSGAGGPIVACALAGAAAVLAYLAVAVLLDRHELRRTMLGLRSSLRGRAGSQDRRDR